MGGSRYVYIVAGAGGGTTVEGRSKLGSVSLGAKNVSFYDLAEEVRGCCQRGSRSDLPPGRPRRNGGGCL